MPRQPRLSASYLRISYLRAQFVGAGWGRGPAVLTRTLKRILLSVGLVAACTKGDSLSLPSDGEPAAIAVFAGDDQSGRVGATLSDPLVVQVTDSRGRPVEGATVAFEFTQGGPGSGAVPSEKTTNSDGMADARLVLGTSAGPQAGQARVVTAQGRPTIAVPFTAMALSESANEMIGLSGDNQTGPAGSTLAQPLVVQVLDALGNPVPGVPITWTPEGGGGVSSSSVTTDNQGRAAVERILGPTTGPQATLASSEGLAGSPVTFVHTVVAGTAAGLSIVSGNDQTAPAGLQLAADLVVQLLDENGNGVAGTAVTWVVAIGGGSVTPQNSITDGAGRATAQWTLGAEPGDNRLDAVVTGVGIANFKATATPGLGSLPALVALNGGNGQTGTVGTTLPTPLSVRVTTGSGGPAAGVSVAWAVSGGGSVSSATSVTSSLGIAQVFRTLGATPGPQGTTASVTGLAGSPVSFESNATPGAPPSLFLSTQPSESARHGVKLSRQPVIQLRTAAGADVQVGGVEVTVVIGEGGGELTGTTHVSTDGNGRAAFTDLAITGAPGRRTLAFAAANFTGTTSSGINLSATPTTTAITGDSPDPSAPGEPVLVSFRVTSEGPTPLGTVSVSDGVDGCAATLDNGAGSCSVALRTGGPRTLTATYNPATGFAGSSDTEGHAVNAAPPPPPAATTTTITADDPDPSDPGQGFVVSFTVTSASGTPSGTMIVTDGVDSCTDSFTGTGACLLTLTTSGQRTLTATYQGSPTFKGSSATERHNVNQPSPDNKKPKAEFDVSCTDLTCAFTDRSTDEDGNIASHLWDFGDGSPTSAEANPSHVYSSGGKRKVTLTVTDDDGATDSRDHDADPKAPPPANTTTTITGDDPDPSDSGQPITVTFTVTSAGGTPSGDVHVTDPEGGSCTAAVSVGSCTYSPGGTGSRNVTATYEGNSSFDGSADTEEHSVNPPAAGNTTTAITSDSPDPSDPGESVTVNFTVSSGSGTPNGTVTVTDGVNSCTDNFTGSGSCQVALTTSGTRTLTATYAGNSSFNGSSGTASHEVNPPPPANTTTTITGDGSDPSNFGQPITVTFTVTSPGGTPGGNVQITDEIGGSCTGTVGAGSCSYTPSGTGNRTITATYAGNSSFNGSSDTEEHAVNQPPPANTTTTITSDNPDPSDPGESITVNFTVTAASGTPNGNVVVTDENGGGCSATVAAGGCAYTPTGTGARTITAAYQGNSSFNGSDDTNQHTVNTPPPPNQAPVADFTFSCPANGCDFTDTSTDDDLPLSAWAWDFGDPGSADNTSTLKDPSHFYPLAGTYTVTLTVTDGQGLASTTPASQPVAIANNASAPAPKK